MQKSVYEDYKYVMLDSNSLYVGAKYTLKEIIENEEILFKFRKTVMSNIIQGSDPEDTLETVLYYLKSDDFRVQIFKQMRSKVGVSVIREKKSLFGKSKKEYVNEYIPIVKFVSMTTQEKEAVGIVVHELKVNKLALFTV